MKTTVLRALTISMVVCAASTVSADARTAARDAKVDTYIRIYNVYARSLAGQRERYASVFGTLDPAATPCATAQRPEREIYHAAFSEGQVADFRRDLRRAPRLPQDRLATEMLDAVVIALPAWDEAYDYYRRDVDSTDACALGNAIHARLMPAWTRFFTAEAEMSSFLEQYSQERDQRVLVEIEREHGRNFRFYHLNMLGEAGRIREALGAEHPDLAAISASVDALATAHGEIAPRAQTAPREVNTDLRQHGYMPFLLQIEAYVSKARALIAALRATPANASAIDRAGGEFARGYVELVRTANAVRFTDAVH